MNTHFQLPDLIEIQRHSFLNLLARGLQEEFKNCSKITTSAVKDLELNFDPKSIHFERPSNSVEVSINKRQTYETNVYIWGKLIYKPGEKICAEIQPVLSRKNKLPSLQARFQSSLNLAATAGLSVQKCNRRRVFQTEALRREFIFRFERNSTAPRFREGFLLKKKPFFKTSFPDRRKKNRGASKGSVVSKIKLWGYGRTEKGKLNFIYQRPRYPAVKTLKKVKKDSTLAQKLNVLSFRKGEAHLEFRICLGALPLMTSQGHFIISGCPRVIVTQIILCNIWLDIATCVSPQR